MTLDSLIILAGAFVATLPFLGLPNTWDTVLFFLAGVLVVCLGIVVRRKGRNLNRSRLQSRDSLYVDNVPESLTNEHGQS